MTYLLGLDYGTGGAKACIIDDRANVLVYSFVEYKIYTDELGWAEHEANNYWNAACFLIKDCIKKSGIDASKIVGIGTSSALPSMVMVDKEGNPIKRAYNLMDRRAVKEVQWIKDHIGDDEVFRITGNRLDDHPAMVNLMWERNHDPENFKKIYKVLTIDGFIRLKLTGNATMHYSAAPFYGVSYNIRSGKFDETIMKEIDIPMSILPEITTCEAIIGEVTKKAASDTGLVQGIKVAGGQVDCNAGWIGAGAINEGDIQMNLGTCGNFGIIHKDTDFFDSMIAFPYTTDSKHTFITVPTTTTGGQSLRYIRDNFSPTEISVEKLTNINAYDLLSTQAQQVSIGSDGLIILPYLMGERTPIWDVYARGVVFGLTLSHTKSHVIRATMEGVAFALYDSFRLIKDSGKKMNYPIILNEGGAKNAVWRRIITDVFNVPTALVKSRIGAPFGDCILAGVATGVFNDFSIAKEKAEYIDLMEPDEKAHNQYMEYYSIFKNVYNHLKSDFIDLAELKQKYN